MAQAQADPNIKFIATFGHRPAYSSGHYSGSATLKGMLDKLGDTYSKYTLNINGHSNNYERSRPQHGVTHVTVGTGGANLTQNGTCLWSTCTKPAWSAFRAMHLGALKLHFTGSGIVGSFICGPAGGGKNDVSCTKGSVVDNFTIASPTVASSAIVAPMATAAPDVIVTSFSYANGIFKSTVKNQGTAATPAGVVVGVKYSVDGSGKTWGSVNGPLAAGASVTIGTNGVSYVIPTGTHIITAFVNDMKRFAESNETNNTLSQTVTDIDTQAPTVPNGLVAKTVSSSQINLSWAASTDNKGVTGYKIYRNGSLGGTFVTTAYSDSGLMAGTSYSYTVTAYDAAGNNSGNSAAVSATTTPPPPPSPSPSPPNASVVQGFAAVAGVTGGAGGANIVVTNLNESGAGSLRAAIATSGTRNITFTPNLTGTITWSQASGCTYVNYPNMTIDGAGAHVTISGMTLSIHKSNQTAISNVIVRNLTFANNFADRQAILMDYGSSRVWIDHNTFYNNSVGYTGQGVYISDNTGKTTPTYSTVSWNHFKAPNVKSTVIGQRSSITPSGIRTSYHHNWFDGVEARNPKVAGEGVVVHFWNNYISNWGEYGSGINDGANFWAENNYYETNRASKLAIIPDYGVPSTGPNASYWPSKSVKATGNYLVGNLSVRTIGTFPMSSLTYSVSPEVANNDLKARIMQGAGAH